ncbi:MAG: response regulator, partial [Desulfovermiculus sp.]|nr:response regulator [Desulfovermiculus sp.]
CYHKVDIAHNGRMAIDLFKRNAYDLVSLDYVLPGETTGMDVYRSIRKTNADIPILFISGNLEFLESIKDLQSKDPHVDHVSKPCPQKDYIQAIDKLFMSQAY